MSDEKRFPTDPAKEITNNYVEALANELFAKYTPYKPMSDREACQTAARLLAAYAGHLKVMVDSFDRTG